MFPFLVVGVLLNERSHGIGVGLHYARNDEEQAPKHYEHIFYHTENHGLGEVLLEPVEKVFDFGATAAAEIDGYARQAVAHCAAEHETDYGTVGEAELTFVAETNGKGTAETDDDAVKQADKRHGEPGFAEKLAAELGFCF